MKLYENPVVILKLETLAKLIDEVYEEGTRTPFHFKYQDWCEEKYNKFKYDKVSEILKADI